MTFDAAATLNKNAFTRGGYTFQGWNTQADGTGTAYADEAQYTLTTVEPVTLYAVWQAVPSTPSRPGDGDDSGYGPGENPLERTDITEPETPLSGGEDIPAGNEAVTDITEPETPLAEGADKTGVEKKVDPTKTGDSLNLMIAAAGVSGLALVWLALTGRKQKEENI
jgi:uncharacterized repeat protein (TIGR02543 family)/LPXTG-motif cell wall-anchored protein